MTESLVIGRARSPSRAIVYTFAGVLLSVMTVSAQGQEMKCSASDGAEGDEFGYSVGIEGEDLIVGAVYDDDAGRQAVRLVGATGAERNPFYRTLRTMP